MARVLAGIATNDGSPNLQQGAALGTNVALGTTGLDVRQVRLTFGNEQIGTITKLDFANTAHAAGLT